MDGSLRSGTITLLFTDIEGSTRLLRELGEGYADVIAEHRRALRAAFAAHSGREIDTQGDSFFVVFDTARDAVSAAVEAQHALAARDWPLATRVRVRMGIHTGEPAVDAEGYLGLAVHRCARICSAANGRQVLLSTATRSVVGEDEVPGTALRDLGAHLLKDFEEPEHLYQLIVDGLPPDLRPIRTDDAQAADPPSFAGREHGLTVAVQAAIAPGTAASEAAAEGPGRPWGPSLRGATAAVARTPLDVLVLAALVVLGVAVSMWIFVAAGALLAVLVAAKAAEVRRGAVDSIGLRLYAMGSLAPDEELAERVKELGGLLVQAGNLVRDADDRLGAHDRRALAHELDGRRAAAVSVADARRVDALARAIDNVDALGERRTDVTREVRRVEARIEGLRTALFDTRLGRGSRDPLVSELVSLHADLEDAVAAVRQELATSPRVAGDAPRRRGRRLRARLHLRPRRAARPGAADTWGKPPPSIRG